MMPSQEKPIAISTDLSFSHVEQVSKNPKIDVDLVRSSKYLHEFDRYVVVKWA